MRKRIASYVLAAAVSGAALGSMLTASAEHGHHAQPGHPKLRKAVCILVAHEQNEGELSEVPDIGCK